MSCLHTYIMQIEQAMAAFQTSKKGYQFTLCMLAKSHFLSCNGKSWKNNTFLVNSAPFSSQHDLPLSKQLGWPPQRSCPAGSFYPWQHTSQRRCAAICGFLPQLHIKYTKQKPGTLWQYKWNYEDWKRNFLGFFCCSGKKLVVKCTEEGNCLLLETTVPERSVFYQENKDQVH